MKCTASGSLFPLGFPESTGNWILILHRHTASLFEINNRSCLLIVFLQVPEHTSELALLAQLNQELEEEVEVRKSAHMDKIPTWRSETDDCSDERLIPADSVSLENAPSTCFAALHR